MDIINKLPTVKDFRLYGRFHDLPELDLYQEIPAIIMNYIYPAYSFMETEVSADLITRIKMHCIIAKKQAIYEDNVETLKDQKELQIRRLEDKIHSIYSTKCKCYTK